MSPYDKVTFEIEQDDITYTWGGTILATYTNDDNEEMAIVSGLNKDGVMTFKQSDLTTL